MASTDQIKQTIHKDRLLQYHRREFMRAIQSTYPDRFDSEKSRALLRKIGFKWGLMVTLELFYPNIKAPGKHITLALSDDWRDAVREVLEDGLNLPFTEPWAVVWVNYLCDFILDELEDGPPPRQGVFLVLQEEAPKLSDYLDDLRDCWEPTGMTEKQHDALLLERGRSYRKAMTQYFEQKGFVSVRLPTDPRHYKWLALARVGGKTASEISELGFHGSGEVTPSAIAKGITAAADRCELEP